MVLIKEMELPDNCNLCKLKDMYYGECNVKHKRIRAYLQQSTRPTWCPLSEVEPYGPEGMLYKEK